MKEKKIIDQKVIFHPYRRRNTLAVKMRKKTLILMGIYSKYQTAKTTRWLPRPNRQNEANQTAKTCPSTIYTKNYSKLLLADANDQVGENIINFKVFRDDKKEEKNKIKTSQKGLDVISKKSSKSMNEILSEVKKPKLENSISLKNTKPKSVELFFKQLTSIYFPEVFSVEWSGKELGYAKTLVTKVKNTGLDFEKLLTGCFSDWELFGEFMLKNKSYLKEFPSYPTIGFLAAHPQEFVNFKPTAKEDGAINCKTSKLRSMREIRGEI